MNDNKIFKQGISLFGKLFMLDVGCFLLSFFIFGITQNQLIRALIQAVQIVCVVGIIYSQCHALGDRDSVLINTGSKKNMPLKGLYIGLVANIPFFATGFMLAASKIFNPTGNFVAVYRIANMFYFPFNMSIMPADQKLSAIGWGAVVLSLLTLIIIPVFAMFSYILGQNRFSFKENLLYKKSEQE